MYLHRLYDIVIASERRLPAAAVAAGRADLIIREHFSRRAPDTPPNQYGYTYKRRADGSVHVSWSDLFDFVVSARGSHIDVHAEASWHSEPVYTYLLSQVVSVALLEQAIESLHGSAISFDGTALLLLGSCGFGKSTLTAAALQAGAKLLTDDLVVLRPIDRHYQVAPGAFRLKLDPLTAQALQFDMPNVPMNDGSGKHVYMVEADRCETSAVKVGAFVLLAPAAELRLERIEPSQAVREILSATFNPLDTNPERLQRLLVHARSLSHAIPMWRLHVPRSLTRLPEAVRAIRPKR